MDTILTSVESFINDNRPLLDIHLVDFITEDLWTKRVPVSLQKCLLKTQAEWYELLEEIYNEKEAVRSINSEDPVRNFIINGRKNTLDCTETETIYSQKKLVCDLDLNDNESFKHCMKTKKSIEINIIAKIVNKLCKDYNVQNIIDVGSGKGYLSSLLALKYNFNVLGLDSQTICSQNAITRNDKIKKRWKKSEENMVGSFKCIQHLVEEFSPITSLWSEMFPIIEPKNFLLVGLHTCGDLSVKMINVFLQNPEFKVFLNIGCCYHLLEEEFSLENNGNSYSGFPLSKTLRDQKFTLGRKARMLASESIHRMMDSKSAMNPALFYRSLLQVLIRDKFNIEPNVPIGRIGKKCSNFLQYVRKSLTKLKLDNEKISDEEINSYVEKYKLYRDQMECLYRLRSILAPVVESMMIIDRYCYLKSQEIVSEVYIHQVCSPIHSPRCYAIIAIKRS